MVVYRQFPDKMVQDTYTPRTLKIQILVLACLLISLPLAMITKTLGATMSYGLLLVLGCSYFSFCLSAIKKDIWVGLWSPVLLTIRGAAIGLGAFWGFARGRL